MRRSLRDVSRSAGIDGDRMVPVCVCVRESVYVNICLNISQMKHLSNEVKTYHGLTLNMIRGLEKNQDSSFLFFVLLDSILHHDRSAEL